MKNLKLEYSRNNLIILEKERGLSDLLELELKEELSHIKAFERLNDEKITPHFLNMAKKSTESADLSCICDNNGTDFKTVEDRQDFISGFFKNLYRKPENEEEITLEHIHTFLGEVSNIPEVQNSKLTDDEKIELDRPLTVDELNLSVKKANMSSSSGIDGIGNKFIAHFWDFFRNPLLKYALTCYDKGTLTDSF